MKTLTQFFSRIISLCCGGGIGEFGSRMHFQTALAVDYEEKFLKSFEANHPGIPTLCGDIGKPETIAEAMKIAPEVEGIIASTPCVDVAQCKSMELADRYSSEMTLLYVKAIDWVEAYRPQFYICEIVKGIETLWFFHTATARLEHMGYKWTSVTLDAADWGVPQHRVRTFMLAVRNGIELPKQPVPTHGDDAQRKKNPKLKKYVTLKDCIYDLYLRELKAIKKGEKAHETFLQDEMLGVAKLSAKRAFYLSFVPPGGNWKHLPKPVLNMLLNDLEQNGTDPFDGLAARFAWLAVPSALRTGPSVIRCSMPIHPGMDMRLANMVLNDYVRPSWTSPSRTLAGHPCTRKLLIPPGVTKYSRPSWESVSSALLAEPANRSLLTTVGIHPDDIEALQKAGISTRNPASAQPSNSFGATPIRNKRARNKRGYLVKWPKSNERALSEKETTASNAPIITRYLNVREYCRIMGLPDSFVPIGSIADKYRMIGNGICPAVMEKVCGAVAAVLPNPPKSKKPIPIARSVERPNEKSKILVGDALDKLKTLPAGMAHCCVTSPPYFHLRDYGVAGQIGIEKSVEEYVQKIVNVFREVRRVLSDDGTVWLNLGDCYSGSNGTGGRPDDLQFTNKGSRRRHPNYSGLPAKNLIGIPWRVALALQADGWFLRADIVWHKPAVFPDPVKDRPTRCHEFIFLLSKSKKYYYDQDAIREKTGSESASIEEFLKSKGKYLKEPGGRRQKGLLRFKNQPSHPTHPLGRNKRTVWTIPAGRSNGKGTHFATFPEALVEPCIKAGCPPLGIVIDPFAGIGTTGIVAKKLGREFIGIELNPKWAKLAERNVADVISAERLTAA